jgi:hypothetical protein
MPGEPTPEVDINAPDIGGVVVKLTLVPETVGKL